MRGKAVQGLPLHEESCSFLQSGLTCGEQGGLLAPQLQVVLLYNQ